MNLSEVDTVLVGDTLLGGASELYTVLGVGKHRHPAWKQAEVCFRVRRELDGAELWLHHRILRTPEGGFGYAGDPDYFTKLKREKYRREMEAKRGRNGKDPH